MDIVPLTDKQSFNRIIAKVNMADAFIEQGKLADAKECCETVCGILEKRKNKTFDAVFGFMLCAISYNSMKEFETAISILQKALVIIEGQGEFPASMVKPVLEQVSAILVKALLLAGKVEEAIPYLEVEVQTEGTKYGSKSKEVGAVYSDLGTAYFSLGKLQLATQAYMSARDILDECLGSHHMDSINISKSLCCTYEAMGSYSLAIPILEEIIRRLEVLGPSAQDDLDEALEIMAFMKKASVRVTNNISDVLESLSGLKIFGDSPSTRRCFGIFRFRHEIFLL